MGRSAGRTRIEPCWELAGPRASRGRSRGRQERKAHAHTARCRAAGWEGPQRVQRAEAGRTRERSACRRARARKSGTQEAMAPPPEIQVLRCCSCLLFQAHQVGLAPASPSSWLRNQGSSPRLALPRLCPQNYGAVSCGCGMCLGPGQMMMTVLRTAFHWRRLLHNAALGFRFLLGCCKIHRNHGGGLVSSSKLKKASFMKSLPPKVPLI